MRAFQNFPTYNSPFAQIDACLRAYYAHGGRASKALWEEFQRKTFTPKLLEDISNEWGLDFFDDPSMRTTGILIPSLSLIGVNSNLSGFDLDNTLLHEIVHIPYYLESDDTNSNDNKSHRIVSLLVEWKARQLRRKPYLLEQIWRLHGRPQIYDRISYEVARKMEIGVGKLDPELDFVKMDIN